MAKKNGSGVKQQLGCRAPASWTIINGADAGRVEKALAHCVYVRARRPADALLASSDAVYTNFDAIGLHSDGDLSRTFKLEDCLTEQTDIDRSRRMSFERESLRFLLEEEAYLAAVPATPKLPEKATETINRRWVSPPERLAEAKAFGALSDCVTFKASDGSDTLLCTMPGSLAERGASIALASAVGSCLFSGQQFKLTPLALRRLVADGMWNRYVRTEH